MQVITYSKLVNEADDYWRWAEKNKIAPVPKEVAREGAGSELRTPIMHYGVVVPVYLSVIRYLKTLQLKPGMRLIELGSGSGRVLSYLKSVFPELEIWGVDYSEGGVKYAKQAYKKFGVKFQHTSAQDTSLKSGYFDFVISSHVIEHLTKEDGLAFMQETKRLLKKGGHAFIGTPERRRCQELYMKNPTDDPRYRLVPPHEHEYTLQELKSLALEVFPKDQVRVDLLINPVFLDVFKSSIEKFRPHGGPHKAAVNYAYRGLRDKAPRPFFDTLTRMGAARQIKKFNTSFQDILYSNSIAPDEKSNKKIPENLFLVCQK